MLNQMANKHRKKKIQKMKAKYKDQDDEEREMRLALIGSKDVKNFKKELITKEKITESKYMQE